MINWITKQHSRHSEPDRDVYVSLTCQYKNEYMHYALRVAFYQDSLNRITDGNYICVGFDDDLKTLAFMASDMITGFKATADTNNPATKRVIIPIDRAMYESLLPKKGYYQLQKDNYYYIELGGADR